MSAIAGGSILESSLTGIGTFPVTDVEWLRWWRNPRSKPVILVEVDCLLPTGVSTAYLATQHYRTSPTDNPANIEYDGDVLRLSEFTSQMTEALSGKSTLSWGDLTLQNANGSHDWWLQIPWHGHNMRLYVGDATWHRQGFRLLLDGVVQEILAPAEHELTFRIKDKVENLNKEVQTEFYPETATVGAALYDIKGKPLPILLGEVEVIDPILVDGVTHTYQIHDGEIASIVSVRDNGAPVGFVENLAQGKFSLISAPFGKITCHAIAKHTTVAACVRELLVNYAGLSPSQIDSASFVDLDTRIAPHTNTIGLYITEKTNLIQVLDEITTSVNAYWTWTSWGLFVLGYAWFDNPWNLPSKLVVDNHNIKQTSLKIERVFPTSERKKYKYARNYAVQDKESIAATVSDSMRARLSEEFKDLIVENAYITPNDPTSVTKEKLEIESLLVRRDDATFFLDRAMQLRNQLAGMLSCTLLYDGADLVVGDFITLNVGRFDLNNVQAMVVGLKQDFVGRKTDLTVLYKMPRYLPTGAGVIPTKKPVGV